MELQHKALSLEVKEVSEGGSFTGYGAVFGNVDLGRDLIQRGAFSDSLSDWRSKGKWPKMLWHHNPREPIGVWTDMKEDDYGLHVSGRFTMGVAKAAEAYALLKDNAIDGLSIGYRTQDDEWDRDTDVRKLKKLDLMEVSLVTVPMNPAASVTDVKAAEQIKTIRDFEAFLRDEGGFSHSQARKIAEHGYKSSEPRDEDGALNGLLATLKSTRQALPS